MNLLTGSIIAVALSFFLGSIPTGLWLGQRFRGIDIREHGSKNIGATNTMRILGKKLGAIALVCDITKGVIPVLFVSQLADWEHLPLVCGLAAILGHTFSVFVKFRGGKGVATSAGVFLGLAPIPTLAAIIAFVTVLALTRMVSASSITAAVVLSVAVFFVQLSLAIRVVTVVVALLVIFKHRTNIQRILAGNESKI